MLVSLVDMTGGKALSSGETLSTDVLKRAAELFNVYLNRYVGAYWGIPGGAMVSADAQPGSILANIRWAIEEAPGAEAYHANNIFGAPDIEDGFSLSNGLWIPGGWATAMSHELVETVGDPGANRWCAGGDGKMYALELADAVEVQSWLLTLPDGTSGYVSNFLLPSFFCKGAPPPYDYMTAAGLPGAVAPSGPFQTANGNGGNYQIVATDAGDARQVTAMGDVSRRLEKKKHPSSRAARRGLYV